MSFAKEMMSDSLFEATYPFGLPSWQGWYSAEVKDYIPLAAMSTGHIINCMKLVGEDDLWYGVFQKELERRVPPQ